MFNMGSAPSLADIAAVTRNGNGNNGGFGDGNGWWVLIILFALFGGWGRGNYGGQGGSGECCGGGISAEVQRGFDNQGVMNKLNGLENGLCSLGYDQLAQMNGITQTVMQTGYGLQQAIQQDTVANMQNTNGISRQLADCCCQNREAIAQVRYDMATQSCATNVAIDKLGDRIERRLTQMEMDRKDEIIRSQESQILTLNQAVSQRNQNEFFSQKIDNLRDTLRPCPTPAYITCNPWANQQPYGSCCGQNNGCCN